MKEKVQGMTLIEVLVVLAVLSVVTVSTLRVLSTQVDSDVAKSATSQIHRVQRAALRYYNNNSAWPPNINALVSSGYLDTGEHLDPWGNPYVLSVAGNDLRIQLDTENANLAARMAPALPRATVSGTSLTTAIDSPGSEAMHDALYARDGSRPLTGRMNANNNDILGVRNLQASGINVSGHINTLSLNASEDVSARDFRGRNFTATGTVQGNFLASTRDLNVGRDLNVNRNATFDGYLHVDRYLRGDYFLDNQTVGGNSRTIDPSATSQLENITVSELRLREANTVGGACPSVEMIGRTSGGEPLACIGGQWKLVGGMEYVEINPRALIQQNRSTFTNWSVYLGTHVPVGTKAVQITGHCNMDRPDSSTSLGTTYITGNGITQVLLQTKAAGREDVMNSNSITKTIGSDRRIWISQSSEPCNQFFGLTITLNGYYL